VALASGDALLRARGAESGPGKKPHSDKTISQESAKQESYSDRLTQVSAMANSE